MKRAGCKSKSLNRPPRPLLIVISGPSGVGKDTVINRMKELGYPLEYVTTVTTRPKRDKERNNVDYHFISRERFQEMIERQELLEWANVYGNWYGVPREPLKRALARGQDVVVKVDIQGAASIKKILPQAVFIFLVPPSTEELALRLKQRHTESPVDLTRRTETAEKEISRLPRFDYMVVNKPGEADQAAREIFAIITAERCRVKPREVPL